MGLIKSYFKSIFTLPKWVRTTDDGYFEMRPSIVYPLALKALDMEASGFSLGVARRCISQYLRIEVAKEPIKVRFVSATSPNLKDPDYKQWRIDAYPTEDSQGMTYEQGCQMWAAHYEKFKKAMP